MSRTLVQRLKRLEIGCAPTSVPSEIVIEIVGPGKEVVRTFVLKGGRLERPKDSPAMRPIARRLRRLEARFTRPADPEAGRLVALLCERMRRHGMECDDAGDVPPQNHQHQTLREVLRARFTKCP